MNANKPSLNGYLELTGTRQLQICHGVADGDPALLKDCSLVQQQLNRYISTEHAGVAAALLAAHVLYTCLCTHHAHYGGVFLGTRGCRVDINVEMDPLGSEASEEEKKGLVAVRAPGYRHTPRGVQGSLAGVCRHVRYVHRHVHRHVYRLMYRRVCRHTRVQGHLIRYGAAVSVVYH